ncbi:MAG: ATP-dependent sacrificial sulfur transferase LarE [Candidatus Aminicenantia bacterium]
MDIERKLNNLKNILSQMDGVIIAYSGGVDSTLLLKVAKDTLGENVFAVTANSETYPEEEIKEAKKLAEAIGVEHLIIETQELRDSNFVHNPPERCYYCKKELFSKLKEIARRKNIRFILDGSNYDDVGDFRPGMKAAQELEIRSPLKEAGLTKTDIRQISEKFGLPTWDKPSLACLASRFPYYVKITPEALRKIAQAEKLLKSLGFKQVRVRHHQTIARIEIFPDDFFKLLHPDKRIWVIQKFKELGYFYVTLDLEGYRTGSMNEPLTKNSKYQIPNYKNIKS